MRVQIQRFKSSLSQWRLLAVGLLAYSLAPARAADEFKTAIAPILMNRCLECHNSSEKSGGLDLSTRQGLMAGGDTGPVLVPGKPDQSPLLDRVVDGEMPPPKLGKSQALGDDEAERLTDWIGQGADWPEKIKLDAFEVSTAKRGGRDWWSFQPIQRPAVPVVKNPGAGTIDAFVHAALEPQGWEPAPRADRAVLIRRLYFDLVGYPPSFDEIKQFSADESPLAYDRLVERLLASPAYGERWGRHWLDVARYAETSGYERDQEKPFAWKYRDWVIRAFNQDMPFDRFVKEQLAGDELAGQDESSVAGTGFLRLGTWNDEPNDPAEYKYERLEDMVHATSTAFLGLTVKCARCHDHKFDPIRQTDYYRVAAAFWAGPIEPGPRESLGGPKPEELSVSNVLGWTDLGREAPPLRLLVKGDVKRPGEVVEPGHLSLVPMLDRPLDPPAEGAKTTGRRRQLADWIVDPRNPLTARVWVNRIWHHHFGKGLVRSPDNFGFTGDKPTHPELLDWLASELVSSGWSTKQIHRLIVSSETYRQSSLHPRQAEYAYQDAGNRLWWHVERRRLDAESLRDALLAADGNLDRATMGGPSFKPVISSDALEGLSMKDAAWTASPPEQQRRRSVYLYTKRGLLPPMAVAFDFMDTTLPCGQRDVTMVPPQALALLNNEFMHERSAGLAKLLMAQPGGLETRIDEAWRRTLGRSPTDQERAQAVEHVTKQRQHLTGLLAARKQRMESVEPVSGGLVLHLDSSKGLEQDSLGRVVRWGDLSGQGHNASQGAEVARPLVVNASEAGGLPLIRFDGKRTFLELGGQVLTGPSLSLFAVVRDRGQTTAHRTLFSNWNGAAGNSTSSIFLGTTAEATVRLSDDFTSSRPLTRGNGLFLLAAVAGAEETSIFQGSQLLVRKGGKLSPRRLDTLYVLGQQGNIQGEWWNGDLAEILVYGRELSETERLRVTAYLLARHHLAQAQEADPETLALASLCHVLLNTNEFLYLD